MHSIFTTIFTFLFSAILSAQTGQIHGIVTDNEGKPSPYVSILLKETQQGVISDDKGVFNLNNLKSGDYTLLASFVGFKTLEKKVTVENDKTLTLALELIDNAEELKEIVIKGYVSNNERIVSASKIAIRPMDLPQSIVSIDRQTLENQQVIRMSDVLMNTNGVYISGTTGGYQEEVSGRGFTFGSTNTFKNGVRYFSGMITELSGIERVEILKGSAAILYGNVAAGGVLNLISKKPKFNFGGEVGLRMGSFGFIKPSFDVYGGNSKKENIAFRMNGSYEQSQSFRQGVSSERYYFTSSLFLKLGNKTSLLLENEYTNDRRTPDFGVGIINYQIVELSRERFLGVAWSYYKAKQNATTATLTHRFSDKWKLNFTSAFRKYSTDLFANTRPNSGTLISKEGTWIRNIQRTEIADSYLLNQLDINGKFKTGRLNHQLLLGMDNDFLKTQTTAYTPLARYDTINVYGTKQYTIRTDQPNLSKNTLTDAPTNRVGVYVQDLVDITSKLKVLAGIRYSYQQTKSDVLTYSTNKTASVINFDGAFSPRLGIVFQPNVNHSFFTSYANSFVLNTGVDIDGNALPPSLFDQYEVGVKNEFFKGKLSANLTAYRILNSNLAQISLVNGNSNTAIKELAGSVKSDGFEIYITARVLSGLFLMTGYSYNETRYVKSNTYVEGSLLRYNPNQTANMSANYRFENGFLNGFSMGFAGVYIGNRFAGRSTRVQVANDAYKLVALPDYTQLDAMFSYTYRNIVFRGKIGNLTNVLSYNVHDDNSVNPIAPRNFAATLSYKF
jgi:iron complex outermembrane recepter protein